MVDLLDKPDRITLTDISSTAWEHPADRAALQTLRAIPGFDEVVRKVMGLIGERGVRLFFTADAIRVGPRQRPKLDALYSEVLETLDYKGERPELFVSQTPFVNAMAVGFERPFIVLNSGAVGLLDREERRVLIGHELGHIMSGHATYTTIALILLRAGFTAIPGLGLHRPAHPARAARVVAQGRAQRGSRRAARVASARKSPWGCTSSSPAAPTAMTRRASMNFSSRQRSTRSADMRSTACSRCSTSSSGRTPSTRHARRS